MGRGGSVVLWVRASIPQARGVRGGPGPGGGGGFLNGPQGHSAGYPSCVVSPPHPNAPPEPVAAPRTPTAGTTAPGGPEPIAAEQP